MGKVVINNGDTKEVAMDICKILRTCHDCHCSDDVMHQALITLRECCCFGTEFGSQIVDCLRPSTNDPIYD